MKIYICHSTNFDFKKELYEPIKNSSLSKHEIIFPHEQGSDFTNSKEIISTCDLIIAEVSHPSTGVGIELGWADKDKKRIILTYKKGSIISKSVNTVSDEMIEYEGEEDLIEKISNTL